MAGSIPNPLFAELEDVVRNLTPDDRVELVERLAQAAGEPAAVTAVEERRALVEAYTELTANREQFEQGQLVQWKRSLRNRELPEYGRPAIVIEVLDQAILDTSEPTDSPYHREPLDLVLGVIDGEGDLIALHFDSRRFEAISAG